MDEWKRATDFLGCPLVMVLFLYGIYHYKNIVGSCCIGRNPNIDVPIRTSTILSTVAFATSSILAVKLAHGFGKLL